MSLPLLIPTALVEVPQLLRQVPLAIVRFGLPGVQASEKLQPLAFQVARTRLDATPQPVDLGLPWVHARRSRTLFRHAGNQFLLGGRRPVRGCRLRGLSRRAGQHFESDRAHLQVVPALQCGVREFLSIQARARRERTDDRLSPTAHDQAVQALYAGLHKTQ